MFIAAENLPLPRWLSKNLSKIHLRVWVGMDEDEGAGVAVS